MHSPLDPESICQALMRQATLDWSTTTCDPAAWAAARTRLETLHRMVAELCADPPQDADSPLWDLQSHLRTLLDLTGLRARQSQRDACQGAEEAGAVPDLRQLRESALI